MFSGLYMSLRQLGEMMRVRIWHHQGAVLVGLSMAIMAPGAHTQIPEPFCACIDLGPTIEAVKEIASVDWGTLDEAAVERMWTEAEPLPCESSSLRGMVAVTAAIERCCSTCGGPFFHSRDESSEHGLENIHLLVCRDSPDQALSELKGIVDVARPQQTDATYEQGWSLREETESIHNAYRWHTDDDTFILEVNIGLMDEQWIGLFDLTRCYSVSVVQKWTLDNGTTLDITRTEVIESEVGKHELWFSYLSQCLLSDHTCLRAERRSFWPRLRSVAESNDATIVFLDAEDCKGQSIGVSAERNSRGDWDLRW
jgi:hypothetical protein